MKFYEKFGNDLFAPDVKVSTILLDNSEPAVTTTVPGQTSVAESPTNGIVVDFSTISKQDKLDDWISDKEYLNYTIITFIAFQNKQDIDSFRQEVIKKSYIEKSIPSIVSSINSEIKYKTVNLSEIVDLNNITTESQILGNYQVNFDLLEKNKDIILYVVPSIDFVRFLSDNGYSGSLNQTIDLITKIYSIEWYVYNILVKGKTIEDEVSDLILNDVRENKQIITNLFSLIPSNINQQLADENPSYITEIFTSFDYEQKLIRSYFFFDIEKYITNNSVLDNLFKSISNDLIEKTLVNYKAINFNIKKIHENKNETLIATFSTSYKKVNGSSNVSIINELSTQKSICFSFIENFPQQSNDIFKYKIEINYQDPFIKYYYDNTTSPTTGLFPKVVADIEKLENYVNDPRNTDSTTGKFIISDPIPRIPEIVSSFISLINVFINKQIDETKIKKIIKSLEYKKSTFQIHVDFISIAKSLLLQIEQLLLSFTFSTNEYSKNSNNVSFSNNGFYFKIDDFNASQKIPKLKVDPSQSDGFKYFTDGNKQYNIADTVVDFTNEASYKIVNGFVNAKNEQITYSSNYDLTSLISEQAGTTINKIINLQKPTQISSLFSKISVSDSVLTKPATQTINSSKETEKVFNDTQHKNINQILSNININQKLDTEKVLNFNLSFLGDMNPLLLIPKRKIQVFDQANKKWISIENITNSKTNSYLARTIYLKGSDMFTSNNVAPPLTNEYFIYTPT